MAVAGVSMEALAAAMALLQTNPTMFASLAGGATVKPAKTRVVKEGVEKKERVVKEIALEDRCRAISWVSDAKADNYGHPVQCSKAKKEGCGFCTLHQKKAEESEEACSYTETGAHRGLFFGSVPEGEELDASKVPFMSADGKVCIMWKGPAELVARIKEAREGGAAFHPFCPEGGGKKNRPKDPDAPVRVRKPKAETEPKEPKEKAVRGRKAKDPNAPKRGQNAYFLFAGSVRPVITEEVKADAEWADKPHSQRFGEIGRRVKARWDALSEEEKAPFLEQEAAEKARYAEEKAAYVPSETVVATEPKKRGRPSKGAEGSRPAGKKTEEERVNAAEAAILAALLASKGMDDDKRVDLIAKVAEKVAGDEDEEEAGDEDAKSVAFDPETAVAEDAEEEDAEEEPYFTVEINGKDVMVMKEDQGELKAGCVYELTTDDEGDVVPGKQIGTWKNDEFVPLPKKPTIVVGGKKA
jgi:hypothetical protein